MKLIDACVVRRTTMDERETLVWDRKHKGWVPHAQVTEHFIRKRCEYATFRGAEQASRILWRQREYSLGDDTHTVEYGLIQLQVKG